ncbi:dienelactone hydrolase family protein [Kitasatospora purpeofusca]|uniref:dienelactone hydrolase family protein n=1 Tax=Kitasatospora purpeofusca TaxID=67352 RepID=UPI002E105D5B|nr:dienelactone hydrolase family protein [Kitasatospora purpeofusca]WSR37027.1 dienelactone hydrolase family protein [Kitasatospora purpeofusca]WSR45272.1 dienelactone hydrolase family protein [Kitasatospora purpeofusca]
MRVAGERGVRVVDEAVMRSTRTSEDELARVEEIERVELDRRSRRYRGDRPRTELRGRTAVVVDDGVASGSTARAACLIARRLTDATHWVRTRDEARDLPVGFFGASNGAAAALWAAAEPDSPVGAVVSRGGRPDRAGLRLPAVTAPTLLIVGGNDDVVIGLNQQAQARLGCENRLAVIPGATHLFEEPGTLEEVASLAAQWFTGHLPPASHPAA